jgi:hypothetical protein
MWEIFLGRFEASLAKHMASSKVGKNRTVPPEKIAKRYPNQCSRDRWGGRKHGVDLRRNIALRMPGRYIIIFIYIWVSVYVTHLYVVCIPWNARDIYIYVCIYIIYSYVVCIPWNAREIYNSCVHIYINIYTHIYFYYMYVYICVYVYMLYLYVVAIPWNAREIHHIHIYIYLYFCVCFKATCLYYTYFASSPRNVREIYTNIYIYVCVCYSYIDISRHVLCSPRNARVICNMYVDLCVYLESICCM